MTTNNSPKTEARKSIWTRFMDMNSGGDNKTGYNRIYIQAEESVAVQVFRMVFKRDPDHTTCSCCGSDFSYSEHKTLSEATAHDRGCKWRDDDIGHDEVPRPGIMSVIPIEQYVKHKSSPDNGPVFFMFEEEIDVKAVLQFALKGEII